MEGWLQVDTAIVDVSWRQWYVGIVVVTIAYLGCRSLSLSSFAQVGVTVVVMVGVPLWAISGGRCGHP